MRILLAGFGTRGDVQPLLALGLGLRAEGHEVVIGASAVFADWVRGHGLEARAVGGDVQAVVQGFGKRLARDPLRLMNELVRVTRAEIDPTFAQTLAAARGADLIVSGVHPAARSVAEAMGIPFRTLLFCPQLVPSSRHAPMGVPWLTLPPFCNRALWWAIRRGINLALSDPLNGCRRDLGLAPVRDVADHMITEAPIVATDPALGRLPPDAPAGIVQLGSLCLPAAGALDPTLERFLAEGEPPVYVGFGSMPDGDARQTTRAIVEALAACGRRGIVLSGWAGLGEGDVPRGVLVVRSVPHELLLPRVALAVHHGGAGTTAAAARAGVPQIVVPHIADQFYWGRQVFERGLGGPPILRRALTGPRLARAIRDVLAQPAIATRAREAAAELRRGDGVAPLVRLLCELGAGAAAHRRAA